jgi:hypothetical protein
MDLVSNEDTLFLHIDAPPEAFIELKNRISAQQAALKRILKVVDDLFEQNVRAHGQITVGDIRYYIGTETKNKPKLSPAAILEKLFIAAEGDFGRVAEAFKSDAFKPGACKTILVEAFPECFDTIVETDLKTGKPLTRLKDINMRFVTTKEVDNV